MQYAFHPEEGRGHAQELYADSVYANLTNFTGHDGFNLVDEISSAKWSHGILVEFY